MSGEARGVAAKDVWIRRFREARLASGLSQKQLGIKAGLDQFVASPRINRYEQGVHHADYPMSLRLAAVMGVPVAYLYCDDEEVARLLLAFNRAPRTARRLAMKLLTESAES